MAMYVLYICYVFDICMLVCLEQAGRSLYERLEIAGMRNQLVRRAVDLKKNIAGNHRFLDILREMSNVVTENKMFNLNQSVDLNTQRMCQLADSNERAAGSLQILQMIIAGIFAFLILDRITGQWSVANSPWFASFYTSAIQSSPLLWFFISLLGWVVSAAVVAYLFNGRHFVKQGVTTIRLKMNKKVFVERLRSFLLVKLHSTEEKLYDDFNDIVKITYVDNLKKDWGGSKPTITFEYDERNSFLLTVTIAYNRRRAKQALVFTAEELRSKIMEELNLVEVWDAEAEDRSAEDLAVDKRAHMLRLAEKEDEPERVGTAQSAQSRRATTPVDPPKSATRSKK